MKIIFILGVFLLVFIALNLVIQLPAKVKDDSVTLKWFGLESRYKLYIDDNNEFSSPYIFDVNGKSFNTKLNSGKWYWKLNNNLPSSFVIDNSISLKRDGDYALNDGTDAIKISSPDFTGFVILNPKTSGKIGRFTNVTAEHA